MTDTPTPDDPSPPAKMPAPTIPDTAELPKPTGWRRYVAHVPVLRRLAKRSPVVPVVRLAGVIGQVGMGRRGLTMATLAGPLEAAFEMPGAVAVALAINSPGGSPVQSALIGKRIRALAAENELPVIAFAEDVAASGGYWLACAADEIVADDNSIIGSIGVISAGFGFTDAIAKIGVERRVYTAGANKALLDPFKPEDPDDVTRLKAIQEDIHARFKALVRDRRGDRLTGDEDELFSGAFWTGVRAKDLGLVDALGDLRGVLRSRYGDSVKLTLVEPRQRWPWSKPPSGIGLPLLSSVAAGLRDLPEGLLATLEERAWWARHGL